MPKSKAPDPAKYAASGTEDGHSIALIMWSSQPEVRTKYPDLKWLFHVPNGGYRTKSNAGRLKAMGVKSGVPDYLLLVRRGRYSGIIIELKRPKSDGKAAGTASDEQNEWLDHFTNNGFGVKVCIGWEDARDTIISYLEYKG